MFGADKFIVNLRSTLRKISRRYGQQEDSSFTSYCSLIVKLILKILEQSKQN